MQRRISKPKNTKQSKSNKKYKLKQSVTKKSTGSFAKRVCSSNLFLKLCQFFERFLFFIRHFLKSSLPFLLRLFNHFFCFFCPPGFEFRFSLFNLKIKNITKYIPLFPPRMLRQSLSTCTHLLSQLSTRIATDEFIEKSFAKLRKGNETAERVRKTRSGEREAKMILFFPNSFTFSHPSPLFPIFCSTRRVVCSLACSMSPFKCCTGQVLSEVRNSYKTQSRSHLFCCN